MCAVNSEGHFITDMATIWYQEYVQVFYDMRSLENVTYTCMTCVSITVAATFKKIF